MDSGARTVRDRAAAATKPVLRWALGDVLPFAAMRRAARRGDLHGRLLLASRGGDPAQVFAELRAHRPLYRGSYAYVATSLPVVREVLSSADFRAGVDFGAGPAPVARAWAWAADNGVIGPLKPPSLLVTEPPDHTRHRRLVTRVFSVRAVERLRDRTAQIAAELLDAVAGADEVDLVESYCTLLPVTVITEILGVPPGERRRVLAFGAGAAPSLDIGLSWRQFRGVEAALGGFDRWLSEHLARLRAEPGDDLLSQLVATSEDGVGLTDQELKSIAGLVLAAGFETTVNLLGNGTRLLHDHPDQLARLRAEPRLWANAVDEILRIDPPVLLTGRTAARRTRVAGLDVPAGALVTTVLAAANRDPDVFAEPADFDVARPNAKDHVSFSAGRHFCLGAALARMEGEVGLRLLFDRFPDLEIRPGARRRETRILRGYATLPVSPGRPSGNRTVVAVNCAVSPHR